MQEPRWSARAAAWRVSKARAPAARLLALALVGLFSAVQPLHAQPTAPPAASVPATPGVPSPESAAPKPSMRQVIARATALTVEAEGWTVSGGSPESGRFTTGFIALDPAEIPRVTNAAGRDQAAPQEWARAEYRYHVRMPSASATAVRAEIRAWPFRAPGGATAEPDGAVTLRSNGQLERAYRRAFAVQLEKLSHLLPPGDKDDP